ncbi:hypothetical protein Achl_4024 (plasmid) [Pseudarthrobacter chlorophenolicus A6]|uniref:Uncharacterized protein n=1 Tax=Pseudarthrobacter chlorophenolicus (strain ATCC 700700 / DSM 12829 / CIP 107037 / JCM 12360 / KCTC 9906 / NCIMB 13794 / A6) TaxID=452863 RepID=B8HHS8_PSECP|nr:hypothetical protein [Pseudarthrobacter chlorophenolicus]ACL41975.1 hypothetical protein Achl_4024 [Pseudarthrobacter chlorophenolicus A6]SDQ19727.1 hypothetical protein SAMN04489738_0675 [Pseudarthrobacter chlorophenolicus]
MRTRYWVSTFLWAALVITSMVIMVFGLSRTMFFVFEATPEMVEDVYAGRRLYLGGTLVSLAAAAWALQMRYPRWVAICAALPAVLIGWAGLANTTSLLPHLVAVAALPAAFAGLLGGVLRDVSRQHGSANTTGS